MAVPDDIEATLRFLASGEKADLEAACAALERRIAASEYAPDMRPPRSPSPGGPSGSPGVAARLPLPSPDPAPNVGEWQPKRAGGREAG
jgi:hypothetical protein